MSFHIAGRLFNQLKGLPNHLLLDIGVDAHTVPTRLETTLTRPDVFYQTQAAARSRSAARL